MSGNKDDSGMSYQQLGFSPSAFLNTSENSSGATLSSSKEMFTSTPAKGLMTTPKTPSILITPLVDEMKFDSSFNRSSNSSVNKRKTIFDTSLARKSSKKKAFVSTTPRTPTPLRSSKKDGSVSVCTETKLATIDEISKILMKKADTTSTPDHDYAKLTNGELNSTIAGDTSLDELTTAGGSNAGTSKTSLRRTLFETPGQNASVVRPLGVNLFTEKELNAIEQMSTCFTPQKEKEQHEDTLSSDSNENNDEQQQRQQQQQIGTMAATTNNPRIEIPTRLGGGAGIGAINEKGGFSFILNPNSQHHLPQPKMGKLTLFQQQQQQFPQQQQQQSTTGSVIGLNQISGRPEIRILPLVGKPMKVPIRRLPPRNLNFSSDNNVANNNLNRTKQLGSGGGAAKKMKSLAIPTQADAFRAVAFGQSHDQKFLTEQARLIMKEIHQASLI